MTFPTRRAVSLAVIMGCVPALAQPPVQADPQTVASQAVIRELNAYVGLMNRTPRASESMARDENWVNMRTGPTGHERIAYGLFSLYDVRDEIAKAKAAVDAEPRMADLDAAIPPYVAAYEALAPLIAQANGYYERADYKVDTMAEGKTLHAKLAPAGRAFLEERAKLEPHFAREKLKSDEAELALIEKQEGRKARWVVAYVMLRARPVVELLPREAKPVVDLPAFDAALATYASAVRSMDEYAAAEPASFTVFLARQAARVPREARPREVRHTSRSHRHDLDRERLQHLDFDRADGDPFPALSGPAERCRDLSYDARIIPATRSAWTTRKPDHAVRHATPRKRSPPAHRRSISRSPGT